MPRLLLVLLALALPLEAETFSLQRGDLPILLVAPHGGSAALEGAIVRQKEKSSDPHFSVKKDLYTTELAHLIRDAFGDGQKPSLLTSGVHRKYVDPNRSLRNATQSKAGIRYHQDFHSALEEELRRLKASHGWVLLIDLHGQSSEDVDLMIGTREGRTIGSWSEKALWGPRSLTESLREEQFAVAPESVEERVRYNGGYIVKTYGELPGVDAWQFEHGRDLRFEETRREKYAELLSTLLLRALRENPPLRGL